MVLCWMNFYSSILILFWIAISNYNYVAVAIVSAYQESGGRVYVNINYLYANVV